MMRNAVAVESKTASRWRILSSTFATSATSLLQSFKYDAPWLHQSEEANGHPQVKNFINGSFETPTEGRHSNLSLANNITIYDPSTNNILSYVPESSSKMDSDTPSALHRAVEAAKQAYPAWSNTPVQNRQRLMLEYAQFLHKKEVREEIA